LPLCSSSGARVTTPQRRIHIPLMEPDRQRSRIRLSDMTQAFASERSRAA